MVRKTANQRLAEREERGRSELLDHLFEPWIGGAGNAETLSRLGPVDPRKAASVTRALETDIVPSFREMTLETQGRLQAALKVLAHNDGEEFRTYWLEMRAPFGEDGADADAIFKVLAPLLGVRLPEGRQASS